MRGFCGCKFRCFIYDFRAVYKYSDKTIVHAASGTDYQEFRSHFTGELYILTVVPAFNGGMLKRHNREGELIYRS